MRVVEGDKVTVKREGWEYGFFGTVRSVASQDDFLVDDEDGDIIRTSISEVIGIV